MHALPVNPNPCNASLAWPAEPVLGGPPGSPRPWHFRPVGAAGLPLHLLHRSKVCWRIGASNHLCLLVDVLWLVPCGRLGVVIALGSQ